MSIDRANFRTTKAVQDYSIKFYNEQTAYICDDVFPVKPINQAQFKVYQYTKRNLDSLVVLTDSKSAAPVIDWSAFTRSDTALLHKLAVRIDPQDERDADEAVADMHTDAAENVTEGLMIAREAEMVTAITTSSNFGSGLSTTLSGTDVWTNDSADPEAIVKTARLAVFDALGRAPNSMAMNYRCLANLQQSPALKDRLKYTSGQSISIEQIKNLFMVDNLFISSAKYNNANEGGTDSLTDILTDKAVVFYKAPTSGLRSLGFGVNYMVNQFYTHEWTVEELGGPAGRVQMLEMGWEYKLRAGAVELSSNDKFVGGYLIDNVY